MSGAVRTIEGITVFDGADGVSVPIDPSETAPRRVYSLEGLLALAQAVRDLEGAR